MFAGVESLIRPPPPPAISINFRSYPCIRSVSVKNRSAPVGIAARIGSDGSGEASNSDSDSLLRAAIDATSLRFQETQRPDPLFIDPYAGGLLSPDLTQKDMEVNCSSTPYALSPFHYRMATKFIDETLVSLLTRNDDLRQIVLLTDGMDTRPYRLNWPRLSVIYDVSPRRINDMSSRRLKSLGAKVLRNCMLVHVALESSDIQAALCNKGFDGSRPSLWVVQGIPLANLTSLRNILSISSSLLMKGSFFMGTLPTTFMDMEHEMEDTEDNWTEKLFMNHGFRLNVIKYNEVARNLKLDSPSEDAEDFLFMAEQLRLSDAQMELWRMHFERIEDEGDEDGFEEL